MIINTTKKENDTFAYVKRYANWTLPEDVGELELILELNSEWCYNLKSHNWSNSYSYIAEDFINKFKFDLIIYYNTKDAFKKYPEII